MSRKQKRSTKAVMTKHESPRHQHRQRLISREFDPLTVSFSPLPEILAMAQERPRTYFDISIGGKAVSISTWQLVSCSLACLEAASICSRGAPELMTIEPCSICLFPYGRMDRSAVLFSRCIAISFRRRQRTFVHCVLARRVLVSNMLDPSSTVSFQSMSSFLTADVFVSCSFYD